MRRKLGNGFFQMFLGILLVAQLPFRGRQYIQSFRVALPAVYQILNGLLRFPNCGR